MAREEGLLKQVDIDAKWVQLLEEHTGTWYARAYQKDNLLDTGYRKKIQLNKNAVSAKNNPAGFLKRAEVTRLYEILQLITDEIAPGIPSFEGAKALNAEFIIAARHWGRSNGHTPGSVHRDCHNIDENGIMTAWMSYNDVTKTSGSIRFWRDSIRFPHDLKSPYNQVRREPMDRVLDLEAKKGNVVLFDARMLHQSLPNETDENGLRMSWFIANKDYLERNGLLNNAKKRKPSMEWFLPSVTS